MVGRERAALACGIVGVSVAAAAYLAVSNQWGDYCKGRFGATHGLLVAAGCLGVSSIGLGLRSDDELERRLSVLGLVAGLGAVVAASLVYVLLTSRGCGD